ncbi:MAG: hypothetical protein O7C56_03955, partial [Rickettsia endosymbiont of Ixodes persulcatus]|nr:hypothetical protein [Rickettsia endosymbiont of Ixodes persulcatus]
MAKPPFFTKIFVKKLTKIVFAIYLFININEEENMNNVSEKNQNIQNGVSNMIHAEQQSFIGCEVFEEKALPIKEKSKLSKIGKKLPAPPITTVPTSLAPYLSSL